MISKEEVLKLAGLACLEFSDEELKKITKDLDDIIAFANTIHHSVEGDTEDIKSVSQASMQAEELREDIVAPSLSADKILSNVAPKKGMFCVKGGI